MGLALGQPRLDQGRGAGQGGEAQRVIEQPAAEQLHRLGREVPEMLAEPRLPGQPQPVARLQQRPRPPPEPPLTSPSMPPVLEGERAQDRIRLAMRPAPRAPALRPAIPCAGNSRGRPVEPELTPRHGFGRLRPAARPSTRHQYLPPHPSDRCQTERKRGKCGVAIRGLPLPRPLPCTRGHISCPGPGSRPRSFGGIIVKQRAIRIRVDLIDRIHAGPASRARQPRRRPA